MVPPMMILPFFRLYQLSELQMLQALGVAIRPSGHPGIQRIEKREDLYDDAKWVRSLQRPHLDLDLGARKP